MTNLNALGFEAGVWYGLRIHGYRFESIAEFTGTRWTSRGAEYMFTNDDGRGFGLMAEHLDGWTRLGTASRSR